MGLMAILAITVACQKNESFPLEADTTLYATMEEVTSTRTMLDDNNNVLWSDGDQIVAFLKTSLGLKYQVTPESVGKAAARFTKVSSENSGDLYAGSELSHNVAYYPYSNTVSCLKSGDDYELSVILPTEQTYTANSFGNGSLPMVAVSEDNNITFKNVCGGIKLQLKGAQTVTSIKLEGKNGEKLSGTATVTAYTDETKPAITMESGASTAVTLNCSSGVQLNESTVTEFIIALPPVLFSKGFTVTVTDADGKTYTLETDKSNTVMRSSLLIMPALMIDPDINDDNALTLPGDQNPQSTSFAHRILLVEHTGTACPNCPRMMEYMKEVAADENYCNLYYYVASHSWTSDDMAYSSAASTLSRALGVSFYPCLTFNLTTDYAQYVSEIKAGIDELHKDVADAGISAVSAITGNTIKLKAEIKAAKQNTYRIAAWLLEDDIYSQQSGATASWHHIHNNALRAMAGESKTEQVYGTKVGTLQAGAKASIEFEIELDNDWDADNCKLLIIASADNGNGYYDVANCAVTPIGESLSYKYN